MSKHEGVGVRPIATLYGSRYHGDVEQTRRLMHSEIDYVLKHSPELGWVRYARGWLEKL